MTATGPTCPLCGHPARRAMVDVLVDIGPRRAMLGVPVLICSRCSWNVVAEWQEWEPGRTALAPPGFLPVCPFGHRASWRGRWLAGRWDGFCNRITAGEICRAPVSYNGGGRGFLDPDHPAAAPGATKATMLAGINQAGAQGATVGELHRDTGLTRGQLAGALSRGIATADITRDGPYLPVFAGRPGYLYRLTRKGRGYLNGNGASSTSKGI